jgi:hypothetical protein
MLGDQTLKYVFGLLLVLAVLGPLGWQRRRRGWRSLALSVRASPKSPLTSLSLDEVLSLDLFMAEIERYECLANQPQLDPIVRCMHQILFGPQISLGSLHRCMAQQQLDLLQFAASRPTHLRA